jgi:hypothetical protein
LIQAIEANNWQVIVRFLKEMSDNYFKVWSTEMNGVKVINLMIISVFMAFALSSNKWGARERLK